jgi:hypothetical protein
MEFGSIDQDLTITIQCKQKHTTNTQWNLGALIVEIKLGKKIAFLKSSKLSSKFNG